MPFTVWGIPESDLTISGGGVLSGFSQGDGSHLEGLTITINALSWEQIFLRDNDDFFDDNDGNQRLQGRQTIFGENYRNNTRVEAEYTLTLEDADGNRYTVFGLNINERGGGASFGTVEGLVFQGDLPPAGVPLTVVDAAEGPGSFGQPPVEAVDLYVPPCFTPGTLIRTAAGPVPVERLKPGTPVWTADHGYRPLRLRLETRLGPARLAAEPALRPVRIAAGALGPGLPAREMAVSPQHRFLVADWRAAFYLGSEAVLVAAAHLVNGRDVVIDAQAREVSYLHLVFDAHEIVEAEGVLTESFLPGPMTLPGLSEAHRAECAALFPGLAEAPPAPARPGARAFEAALLKRAG